MEISLEYYNAMANQVVVISSLLSGFSIAVITNLLVSESKSKLSKRIMISATMAASFFLISVFAMTKVLLMTTEGFFKPVTDADIVFPRTLGGIFFMLGIISLITMISLAGWTKSKAMGRFTTTLGIITLFLIFLMLV